MKAFNDDCIFCKIAKKEIPSEIVYQDDQVTAFKDLSPLAPVHILLIPNGHYASLSDCDAADSALIGHLMIVAAQIAAAQGIDQSGYRVVTNCGSDGGQTVHHLHFHLLGGRPLVFNAQ